MIRKFEVLRRPLLSEKSTRVGDEANQYVFVVSRDATKPEIVQAVKDIFSVEVAGVQTANMQGKRKKTGKRIHWKKAYIRLKAGQEIRWGTEV